MVSPSEITLHWVRQNKIAQKLTVLCQEYLEIREGEKKKKERVRPSGLVDLWKTWRDQSFIKCKCIRYPRNRKPFSSFFKLPLA